MLLKVLRLVALFLLTTYTKKIFFTSLVSFTGWTQIRNGSNLPELQPIKESSKNFGRLLSELIVSTTWFFNTYTSEEYVETHQNLETNFEKTA